MLLIKSSILDILKFLTLDLIPWPRGSIFNFKFLILIGLTYFDLLRSIAISFISLYLVCKLLEDR